MYPGWDLGRFNPYKEHMWKKQERGFGSQWAERIQSEAIPSPCLALPGLRLEVI